MAIRTTLSCALLLITFFFAVSLCATDSELTQKYRFSKVMDGSGNYKLYWSFNKLNENITFAVRVQTTGWVGFGLSPNGQMPNSDVIIGWVDSNGQAYMQDRHTVYRTTPIIDSQQDWYLINGEEQGGYTTLEFTRNFTTCDSEDLEIKAETQRVIWSYHSNDPHPSNGYVPKRHQHRGRKSLNLLGGLENARPEPSDSNSFFVRNDNLYVPSRGTTYWCSNHILYNVTNVWNEEIYIYKASPVISSGNVKYVHHMVIFMCPVDAIIVNDGLCDDISTSFFGCFGGEILGAWAVGGEEFVFPKDVAFPLYIGPNPNKPYKVLLEMHYDRTPPSGILDSSGMKFFYTRQRPLHLAGTLSVSIGVVPVIIIPPKAEKFSYRATCSSSCTDRYIPDDGITVFGTYLHSHLIGTGLTVQHYRNTSSGQCNAVEELKPIDQNLNYDFDFQGDTISVLCHYNSKMATPPRDNVTLGGGSTRDEMCQALLLYYPKTGLANCGTYPDPDYAHRPFFEKYAHFPGAEQFIEQAVNSLRNFQRDEIKQSFDWITWNNTSIKDLQDAMNNATKNLEYCTTDGAVPTKIPLRKKFTADCSYMAVDKCYSSQPRSCCERLG